MYKREYKQHRDRTYLFARISPGIILFLVMGMLLTGTATYAGLGGFTGGSSGVDLQRGLAGHWKFDGNAQDATPNGNHGTVNGATLTTDRKNQTDNAYSFNGTSDYVDFSPFDASGLEEGSLSAWFKTSESGGENRRIIEIGTSSDRAGLFMHSGNVYLYTVDDGSEEINIKSSGTYTDDTWHHAYGYWNSTEAKLYVDGQEVSSVSGDKSLTLPSNGTGYVGEYVGGGNFYFNGDIDDARIYDRTLSTDEIDALRETYSSAPNISNSQKGLVAQWNMDGDANDSTPNSLHGTANGNTAFTASDRHGHANKAGTFDGAGDYVDLGSSSKLNITGDITISSWIKPASFSGQIAILTWANSYTAFPFHHTVNTDGTVRFNGDNAGNHLSCDALTIDSWHHVTATVSGTTLRFYIDGQEDSCGAVTMSTASRNSGDGYLTMSRVGTQDMNGLLDDVRVYNRALSAGEVADLHDSYEAKILISDLQKQLVSHWRFDGNAKDFTPYSNHGTVTGATLTTDRKGLSNRAYAFDGVDDNIEVPESSTLLPTDAITLSVWFKKTGSGNRSPRGIMISKNATYLDHCYQDTALLSIRINGSQRLVNGGTCGGVGEWMHYVGTYDGDVARLYVNGQEVDTHVEAGSVTDNTEPLKIGMFDGGSYNVNGSIDDVRIWSRALSAAEVQELYGLYN